MTPATLIDVLAQRAQATPARLAYAYLERGNEPIPLTYGELASRADAVAHQLRAAGIRPGDRVMLAFPTGLALVVALFGCLRGGVVAVPVAPPSSKRAGDATAKIARHCAAAAVIVDRALLAAWTRHIAAEPSRPVLVLPFPELDVACDATPLSLPRGADAAVLQYTSGSTSEPKGVVVRHESLIANCEAVRVAFRHDAGSTFVGWLPYFHDMGLVANIAQPAYIGAASYLMSPLDFVRNPVKWLTAVDRFAAHTSGGPNFGYDLCAAHVGDDEKRSLDLSRWRVAFSGSEPVRAETIERFSHAFAACGFERDAFFPCYGLAENTVFVSGGPPRRPIRVVEFEHDGSTRRLVSCGLPGPGVTVRIVSPETGRVLGEDELGEIWVGGPSKSDTYFGDPAMSAERLHARTDAGAGPFLRTGDLGFLRHRELYVSGRRSDMLVVRGRNVFPQDVELAAADVFTGGQVRCAAFGIEDDRGEQLVLVQEVAPRAPASDTHAGARALRSAVADALDVTLDRIVFVRRGQIPVTTSGKVRRGECRAMLLAGALSVVDDVTAPVADMRATATPGRELEILSIASQTLGMTLPMQCIDDTPVALGMDSIRIALFAFRLESEAGIVLPIAELAVLPLRSVAEAPPREPGLAHDSGATGAPPAGSLVEPSVGQAVFAHFHALAGTHRRHTVAFALRVPDDIACAALVDALETVCRRHTQLRLRGTDAGVILDAALPVTSACRDDADSARRAVRELIDTPLSLGAGPLADFTVVTGGGVTYLGVRLHHYVTDLWSVDVLLHDLSRALRGETPPRPADYGEFVRLQRDYVESAQGRAACGRWGARLAAAGALELPLDRPRPDNQTMAAGVLRFAFDEPRSAQLFAFAKEQACTPFVVLAAAYAALLCRFGSCRDVVIGVPLFGRPSGRFAETVGLFVNTVPLRVDVPRGATLRTLVDRLHADFLACLDDGLIPLAQISEAAAATRARAAAPLFRAMLTVQNAPLRSGAGLLHGALGAESAAVELNGQEFALEYTAPRAVDVDVDLAFVAVAPSVSGYLAYNEDVFSHATAARLLDGMEILLAAALDAPDTAVDLLPVYAPSYAEQALHAWAQGPIAAAPRGRVEHLFIEQAESRPAATAVIEGGEEHTYGSLRSDVARLAERLREMRRT